MTDYSKLKALAEDAIGKEPGSPAQFLALQNMAKMASPAAVLELIAEIERQATQFKEWQASHHANYCAVAEERDQIKAECEGLRKEREGKVLIPAEPSDGLLMSMAIRKDHALGCPGYYDQKVLGCGYEGVSHARMVECAIGEMRKLHEEVVGAGFYSPQKEADYAAMSKEASNG